MTASDLTTTFRAYLEEQRQRIDAQLERLLPPESAQPSAIHRAMRYSVFAGGKRIRSIFCLEAARLISSSLPDDIDAISCSLELVHTYSLIHDDLPALDNDDYRRGKLTCHKAFGEANAILAGDALLTQSFYVLGSLPNTPPHVKSALVSELAQAAGTLGGMIGGQVLDLEATNNSVTPGMLETIHRAKTAALFRASVCLGAIAAEATAEELASVCEFGENAGLAFQVTDDILDVESSRESLGKTAGKDAQQKKVTYPAVYGLERSRQIGAELIEKANAALDRFGSRGDVLKELAHFLVSRKT